MDSRIKEKQHLCHWCDKHLCSTRGISPRDQTRSGKVGKTHGVGKEGTTLGSGATSNPCSMLHGQPVERTMEHEWAKAKVSERSNV
mmetsp:Transcript_66986/g.104729  ORF Transcript_66986/g.104729 Transcript_66986/m.104729 type:complete len:86 (-) Transcript_66986:112-369(-)